MHGNHPSKQKLKFDEVHLQRVMRITLHQQGFLEEITTVRKSLYQLLLIRGRKNDSQTSRVTCLQERHGEESNYSLHCVSAPTKPEAQQNNAHDVLGGLRFLIMFSHSLCTWNFLRKERKPLDLPVRKRLIPYMNYMTRTLIAYKHIYAYISHHPTEHWRKHLFSALF